MSMQPFSSDNGFSTTGNIIGDYIYGNGSQLTGITSTTYNDSNVAAYLSSGNVTTDILTTSTVSASGGVHTSNISIDMQGAGGTYYIAGTYTCSANTVITAGNIVTTSVPADQLKLYGTDQDGANIGYPVTFFDDSFIVTGYNFAGDCASHSLIARDGNVNIVAGITGNLSNAAYNNSWTFGTNGQVTAPDGTISGPIEGPDTFGFYNPNNNTNFIFETNNNYWQFNSNTSNLESGGGISVVGNIAGNYFIGNGSQLTGVTSTTNTILNGSSSVSIAETNGSITIAVNGTPTANITSSGIALGSYAGQTCQGSYSLAIGYNAGQTCQRNLSLAIGYNAGQTTQGCRAIAIGQAAGQTSQQGYAIAVGCSAGLSNQGCHAVALGVFAGEFTQGTDSIAIGSNAGGNAQGTNSIAIGRYAGYCNQAINTIILNATGCAINGVACQLNSFYVAPIRSVCSAGSQTLYYCTTTKEITSGPAGSSYGNTEVATYLASGTVTTDILTTSNISATGCVKATNFYTTGSGGNITGANIVSATTFTATGNVYGTNIVGTYLYGCGAGITGGYSNSNVTTLLSSGTVTTDILTTTSISATGTVYGSGLVVGGAQLYCDSGMILCSSNGLLLSTNSFGGVKLFLQCGYASVAGDVHGATFYGNAAGLTCFPIPTQITNGNSNLSISVADGPVIITSGGSNTFEVDNSNITISGNLITTGNVNVQNEIIIANQNDHGGDGYAGMFTLTNTCSSATTPNKFVRLDLAGSLQVVNSDYTNVILSLTNAGSLSVPGDITGAYLYGCGAGIANVPSTYNDSNVALYLSDGTVTTDIITTGNIVANAVVTNLIADDGTGNILITGNLLSNDGYNLGLPSKPWTNAYFGPQSLTIMDSSGNLANAVVIENSDSNTIISSGGLVILGNNTPVFEVRALTGQIYSNAQTIIVNTVNSANTTSGSLQTAGGVGIAKDLYVGGNITAGVATVTNLSVSGNIYYTPVYGQFINTGNLAPAINTPTQITLTNSTGNNNKVTFYTDGNITIQHAGIYSINASLQATRGSSGATSANVYIWFRQNGIDVPESGFFQAVSKSSEIITTTTWVANVTANSNVSVMMAQDDTIRLQSYAANSGGFTHPAVPSVRISINPDGA